MLHLYCERSLQPPILQAAHEAEKELRSNDGWRRMEETRSTRQDELVLCAQPQEKLLERLFLARWNQRLLLMSSEEHLSRGAVHSLSSCMRGLLCSRPRDAQHQPLHQRWTQLNWTHCSPSEPGVLRPQLNYWGLPEG